MNKVNGYSTYTGYYDSVVNGSRNAVKSGAAGKTEKAEKADRKLSQAAKNLLKELQKKYGNMDFIVADYESEEEAESYLRRGTKEYSVLIDPDELEKMAADGDYKDQMLGQLEDATKQLADLKNQLKDQGQEVKRLGISFNSDGTTSLFAELEKVSEKQRERIEKSRADRKEEAREKEKADAKKKAEQEVWERLLNRNSDGSEEKVKRTIVRGSSVEELLEQIKNVDWDSVKETGLHQTGGRIDFMA